MVSSLYFANFLPYMIIFQPFAPKLKIKLKPETKNPGFGYLLHPLSRSWNGRVTFSFENKRNDGFLHYHYYNTETTVLLPFSALTPLLFVPKNFLLILTSASSFLLLFLTFWRLHLRHNYFKTPLKQAWNEFHTK